MVEEPVDLSRDKPLFYSCFAALSQGGRWEDAEAGSSLMTAKSIAVAVAAIK